MGSVYLGEQTLIGSRVAVKDAPRATSPPIASLVQRLYAEPWAVNPIGHPDNIVNIFSTRERGAAPRGTT